MNRLPVWEITVQDNEFLEIALVDFPAIEENFLKFNKEEVVLLFDSDKMIVSGLVMIPDKHIYRNDSLGERYVFYTADTVAKSAQLFLKNGMKFNVSHTDEIVPLDVIESYLTKASNEFNAPVGSWVITAKVNDAELWENIKAGQFNGFSFQALFTNELTKFSNNKNKEMSKLKERVLDAINSVVFPTEEVEEVIEEVVEMAEEVVAMEEDSKVVIDEAFIDAKIAAIKEEIMLEVANMLIGVEEGFSKQFKEVDEKVEEFGKQPLAKSVQEEVDTPKKSKGAAAYFTKQ